MTELTPEPELVEQIDDDIADDNDEVLDMRGVRKLRNEAKRLRHLLREEQENRASEQKHRESDLARIAAFEKREVEREASQVLIDAEDIWRHTDLETQQTFNNEFGEIVGERVVEAAKRLASERPHLARPNTSPPPSDRPLEGLKPGASPEPEKKPATWHAAIRGS